MSLVQIAAENRDCLIVYEETREAVVECTACADRYLNVASLFFHDIMKIVTGFILRRNEIASPTWAPDSSRFRPLRGAPYVGYRDVVGGIQLEEKEFAPHQRRWSRKHRAAAALGTISRPLLPKSAPAAAIGLPSVDTFQLWWFLRSRGVCVDFPSPGRIPVPDLEPQLLVVERSIEAIFERLDIPDDPRPLTELVRRHILARVEEGRPTKPPFDVLVTGTLLKLEDRGPAAIARHHGIEVLSVMHGGQFGAYDEPHMGYGELTYTSAFVGYGRGEDIGFGELHYGRSLFDQPDYFPADFELVRARFREPNIHPLGDLGAKKVMYVPTSLKGEYRWGPFHDMPDLSYLSWYRTVLAAFPDAVLKLHPKSIVDPGDLGLQHGLVRGGNLQDCMDVPDVFVFDCVSTAFTIAAATEKPIIYFDIGLRNFSPRGRQAVQDRCIWIEADPGATSAKELLERVVAQQDVEKHNSFSGCFSLAGADENSRRVDVVGRVARSLI